MPLPESKSKVLEDGAEALLESGEEAEVVEGEEPVEFASLDEVKPEAAAPVVAKKPAAAAAAPAAAATEEEDVPAELKGKTPAQLAKMYREAQSVIGRQGSELGEYRKKVDTLVLSSLAAIQARKAEQPAAKSAEPAAAPDESEFFAKPYDAVSKAIENHPLIKQIKETLGTNAAETAASRAAASKEQFDRTHPDATEILSDPEFREWVGKSRVRQALLQRAHSKFDFDAGDEVFGTWKALKGVKTAAAKPAAMADASATTGAPTEAEVKAAASTLARAKGAKTAAAQAAAAPTGGASAGKAQGSKKIYRRADVVRLMTEDPDRYEQMADELGLAYAENRVR